MGVCPEASGEGGGGSGPVWHVIHSLFSLFKSCTSRFRHGSSVPPATSSSVLTACVNHARSLDKGKQLTSVAHCGLPVGRFSVYKHVGQQHQAQQRTPVNPGKH